MAQYTLSRVNIKSSNYINKFKTELTEVFILPSISHDQFLPHLLSVSANYVDSHMLGYLLDKIHIQQRFSYFDKR